MSRHEAESLQPTERHCAVLNINAVTRLHPDFSGNTVFTTVTQWCSSVLELYYTIYAENLCLFSTNKKAAA